MTRLVAVRPDLIAIARRTGERVAVFTVTVRDRPDLIVPCYDVELTGPSRGRHSPAPDPDCHAHAWIETDEPVICRDAAGDEILTL